MSKTNLLFKIPSMAIGAAGAAISVYSIVVDGNVKAACETKDDLAEDYTDMYIKNLSSSKESELLEKVKEYVTEKRLDDPYIPFLFRAKNHALCWIKETEENLVPLGLSIMAMAAPTIIEKYKNAQIMPTVLKVLEKIDNSVTKICKALTNTDFRNKMFSSIGKMLKCLTSQSAGTIIAATSAGLLLFGTGALFLHDVLGVGKSKD